MSRDRHTKTFVWKQKCFPHSVNLLPLLLMPIPPNKTNINNIKSRSVVLSQIVKKFPALVLKEQKE